MSWLSKQIKQTFHSDIPKIIRDPVGTIKRGPKGELGKVASKLYGGTFKDIMDTLQGKHNEGENTDVADPVLSAEDMAARARADDVQKKHKEERGRLASVKTKGKKATLLT